MIFSCRDKSFGDDSRKRSRLVAVHEIKWGNISDGMRIVIVHELSSGKVVSPGERVILAKDSEVDFQFLVDTSSLSISLGVERITPFVSP